MLIHHVSEAAESHRGVLVSVVEHIVPVCCLRRLLEHHQEVVDT
jgi:hypothetical protein